MALDRTFTDRASGRDASRSELQCLMKFARDGDTAIVHSMERLARNLDGLRHLVESLTARGVSVEFVNEHLAFTCEDSPMATLMLSVMGAFAEFERSVIRERQREGFALAKQRDVYRGRSRSLRPDRLEELRRRVRSGEPKAEIARVFGISRQYLYRLAREAESLDRQMGNTYDIWQRPS